MMEWLIAYVLLGTIVSLFAIMGEQRLTMFEFVISAILWPAVVWVAIRQLANARE